MKRLLGALVALTVMSTAAACGGLSKDDQALCDRVNKINPYMDTMGVSGDPDSATSVFTALEGADSDQLAQVGRDYVNAGADPLQSFEYEKRAKKICTG